MNIFKIIRSFRYAFQGIITLIQSENNAKFHLLASISISITGFILHFTFIEWIGVGLSVSLVWAAEAFNTAIEKLCDFISPEKRSEIKQVKDLSAAAVLILSIFAAIVGLAIVLKRFI